MTTFKAPAGRPIIHGVAPYQQGEKNAVISKDKTMMSQFSPLGGFLFSLSPTSVSPTSSFLSRKQIIIAILCCPTEEIMISFYFLLPSLSLTVLLPPSSSDKQLYSTAPPPLFAPF